MKRLLLSVGLLLSLAVGCNDDNGEPCRVDDECSGICAQIAICDVPGDCLGLCASECDTDEDCASDEICFVEPGGARTYCRAD